MTSGSRGAATVHGHPRTFAPGVLVLVLALSLIGAIIGLQLVVTLGSAPNTAVFGILVVALLSRLPLTVCRPYGSIHVQNLAQTAISVATFGAANSLLVPIGIPYALGRDDLIPPMFIGAICAMLLDAYLVYRLFGTRVFPAESPWPSGVAAGESIRASHEGGGKARVLALGLGFGVAGSWLGVPMSGFGIALIGNVAAMAMFGIGLLVRGYSTSLFASPVFLEVFPGGDIGKTLLPHGFMIGAGLIALIQVGIVVLRRRDATAATSIADRRAQFTLAAGFAGYICVAALTAVGGLFENLSLRMFPGELLAGRMLPGFILYAAFAAFAQQLIVAIGAMHSGWFSPFAIALIALMLGSLIGFPVSALALLVGFSAATGPAGAGMGYALKAGFLLRGEGCDPAFEAEGRRQQLLAALIAFAVATVTVALSWRAFFAQGLVPPVDLVYAATIKAGVTGPAIGSLLIWAVPGALLQLLGGQRRQLGILFATGLLIGFPMVGWAVLAGIGVRLVWSHFEGVTNGDGVTSGTLMQVFGGGVLAGSALFSFSNLMRKN